MCRSFGSEMYLTMYTITNQLCNHLSTNKCKHKTVIHDFHKPIQVVELVNSWKTNGFSTKKAVCPSHTEPIYLEPVNFGFKVQYQHTISLMIQKSPWGEPLSLCSRRWTTKHQLSRFWWSPVHARLGVRLPKISRQINHKLWSRYPEFVFVKMISRAIMLAQWLGLSDVENWLRHSLVTRTLQHELRKNKKERKRKGQKKLTKHDVE